MNGSGSRWGLRLLEWLAAAAGAITCIVVPVLFAQPQGRDFLFPALYFVEIALCGLLVLAYVAFRPRLSLVWGAVPWAAAGILLTFVILGGFSIGRYLIPGLIAFLAVALLAGLQSGAPVAQRLGIFLVAAVAQGAAMLIALRLF